MRNKKQDIISILIQGFFLVFVVALLFSISTSDHANEKHSNDLVLVKMLLKENEKAVNSIEIKLPTFQKSWWSTFQPVSCKLAEIKYFEKGHQKSFYKKEKCNKFLGYNLLKRPKLLYFPYYSSHFKEEPPIC